MILAGPIMMSFTTKRTPRAVQKMTLRNIYK
jgi:hypothetical protein